MKLVLRKAGTASLFPSPARLGCPHADRRETGRLSPLFLAAVAVLYGVVPPAAAWNPTGHKIVAAIAYERLTPQVRARVDGLIRQHPDYATLLTKDAPADPVARARAAFLEAATWPDTIRDGDRRFYNEARKGARPTPLLPGFPDMGQHPGWHYVDIPYTPDGAAGEPPASPNALTELNRLIREMKSPPNQRQLVYDLPWLEHLAGDVHQPLHCTSRFLRSQSKGDAGGNFVSVEPGGTLHRLWDGAPGEGIQDSYISQYAARSMAEAPAPAGISEDPKVWVDESFQLVRSDVYTIGLEIGSREQPIALSPSYVENSKRIAQQRIAAAGYRLAAVLNAQLGYPNRQ